MLGDRDILGEIRGAREGGSLKTGVDTCLQYGKVVEFPIPGLEKEIAGRLWVGRVSSRGLGFFRREGGNGLIFRDWCGIGHEGFLYNLFGRGVDVRAQRQ